MRVSLFLLGLCSVAVFAQQNLLSTLQLTLLTDQIPEATSIKHAGDGSDRLFITDRRGRIWILNSSRQLLATPFLDIRTKVGSTHPEQGLFDIAFHPDYKSNGRFFLHYTDLSGNTVLSRFAVSGNANVANAASETVFFTATQPQTNHNGGALQFGPDGMLYLALGDGGGGGDQSNFSQTLSSPLGKILRFDVNQGPPAQAPPDNPFVGVVGAHPGVWAYGLRNPWKTSFDRVTGDVWIGDVGQDAWEEIDYAPAASAKGRNYGWRRMEGAHCFNPASNCNDGSLTLPVMEYANVGNYCSVTGGHRYRGAANASLSGVYFFAEFCALMLKAGVETAPGVFQMLPERNIGGSISAFGEDEAGELYYATFYDGKIFRINAPNQLPAGAAKIGVYNSGPWALDANADGAQQIGGDLFPLFGFAGAQRIVGDWNGNGRDQIGVYRDGFWFLDFNGNGVWDGHGVDRQYQFGFAGVTPLVGDWNGDGRDKVGIYINGFWFLDADGDGVWDGPGVDIQASFGVNGGTPLTGDWNGDGKDEIGVHLNGFWFLDLNGNGVWDGAQTDRQAEFGWNATTPVTGDWNGDGKTTIGIFINGFWFLDVDGDGVWDGPGTDIQAQFGSSGMTPLVADWNGDGKDNIGVFVNGYWFLDFDGSASWDGGTNDKAYVYGQPGSQPVTGRW